MTAWAHARLEECCEIAMGQAPVGAAYNDSGEGWPLIAGASDFGDGVPAPEKFTREASKLSQAGDIIVGIRASIGEMCFPTASTASAGELQPSAPRR